jgi:hypothetical protein
LARLEAHKFYSDLIESLLGAVVGIKISSFLLPCNYCLTLWEHVL